MNTDLKNKVASFLEAFEYVFDRDWEYTKEMLGVMEDTDEQIENSKKLGLEIVSIISRDGTFLNPKVDDKTEDWGHRGDLLKKYRDLKEAIKL